MKYSVCGFIASVLITVSGFVVAAPSSEAIEFWIAHEETSTKTVSHQAWQEILDVYLDSTNDSGVNRFDYAAVSAADLAKLESYLDSLQGIEPRQLSRAEQLPFWINLYNALTVKVVLDNLPVTSIRKIRFLTSPFGPWDKNLIEVAGKKLTLNDIEHRILRPIWKDPRIHFSVNCASIGCPNLASKAFTADNSDALMERSAVDFINHARGVDIKADKVVLSSIFDWYGTDFGDNQHQILAYLSKYYQGENKQGLSLESRKIEFQYDWRLNNPN